MLSSHFQKVTRLLSPQFQLQFFVVLFFLKSAFYQQHGLVCTPLSYFWVGWVGPRLSENLDVETWRREKSPSTFDNDGGHDDVKDTMHVSLELLGGNCDLHYTKVHSKWAVSETGHCVFVADINRQFSREKRGEASFVFNTNPSGTAFLESSG